MFGLALPGLRPDSRCPSKTARCNGHEPDDPTGVRLLLALEFGLVAQLADGQSVILE